MTLIRTSPSGPNVEVDAPVDLGPNTIYGNPTAAPGPGTDIALGLDTVLGRVAGNIVAAQVVASQIALGAVGNPQLADAPALTVKANPVNAVAPLQDVPAASNDTVLRRVGDVLDFGPLTPGMLPPAIIPLSSIEPIAPNTVVANATAGAASPTAVAVGLNTVLGRVAGNIVAAQIVTSQIGAAQVTNVELALMDATTVKVNATGAPAAPQDLPVGMNSVLGRVGGNVIAAQLVTAQIALNQVDNTVLAKMASNTVKANATALLADPQDLTVGTNTVLGRVAGNIVAAQLVTAQIAINQVTNAVLAQMAALSVKANATGALANAADLAAASDDTVLRRTAGALSFGPLTPGMIPSAIIPLSAIEQLAANTVVANATAGLASPTAVPVGLGTVLGRVAGNIVAAQVVTAQIALNQVTNAVLAQMAANTVKVNPTAALADPQDLSVGTNTVLGRVAGNIVAAQVVTAQIAVNQVTNAVLAQMAANTVKVNPTAALANAQDLAIGTNAVLGRVAGNIVAAQLVTAQIAVNQVTNSVLAQMAALTVKANATGALADPQDLAAASDDTVLRRTAGALSFGQLTAGMFPSAIIPLSSLATQAANTVVANATAGVASPTAVAIGTNTVLGRVAGNIVAAQLVTAQIAVNQVTNAVLAQMAANTVKVNATAALADPQDLAVGTNTVLGRVASNVVAAQLVNAQMTGGGLGTVKGTALGGVAGTVVDLTGLELGELARFSTIQPETVGGTLNDYALGATINRLIVTATSVFTGIAGGVEGRWLVIENGAAFGSGITVAVQQFSGLSLSGNRFLEPTFLGTNDNSLIMMPGASSLWCYTASRWKAVFPFGLSTSLGANSLFINATAAAGLALPLTLGTNTVLGRVAGNIVAAQLVTAQIAVNQVTNAVLAQMAALTVKANATGALADPQDLAAASDDTVLRRTAGALSFGQLTAGMFPSAIIPLSSLATQAANTVVANATAGVASPTAVAIGTNTVLGRVAGNIVAAQLVTAQIAVNQVTNAVLAQMAANTVKVNATAALADPQDLAVPGNTVVGRVAGNIVAAQLVTNQIAANQITNATMAQMATNTLKGNASGVTADPQDIGVPVNSVVGRVAGNIVAALAVNAQLANMAALTVKANATAVSATPADLAAASDDTVLRRTASTLSFGQLTAGMFPAAIIPLTSLATQAANTVLANATAGVASPTAVAVGTNTVLGRVAGNIVAAQVVNAQITGGALSTVKGVATGGVAGTLQDLTGLQLGQISRFGGFEVLSLAPATVNNQAVLATTSILFVTVTAPGDLIFNGFAQGSSNLGGRIKVTKIGATGRVVLAHLGVGSTAVNQMSCPGAVAYELPNDQDAGVISHDDDVSGGPWRLEARLVPTSGLSPIAANTVLANATAGVASPTALAIGTNTVLGRVAGNIVAAQLVTAQIAVNQVTNAVLAQMAANTVKVNATAALADPQDVTVGTNTVLGRVAGNIVAAQAVNAQITGGALATVKGVAFNGVAGTLQDLTGTQLGSFLRFTNVADVTAGSIPSFPLPSNITMVTFNGVTNVLDGVAVPTVTGQLLIVQHIGAGTTTIPHESSASGVAAERFRLGNYAANTAVIVLGSTAPNQTAMFYYDSSRWVWINQAVGLASIINSALANMGANTVKVNATAGSAAPTDLSVPGNTVVGRVAGNIVAAQLVTAQIAVNQITNALLAQMAANTVKVNATAALADPQDVTVGTNTVVGRVAGNIVSATLVNAQMANMADGTLKGRARGAGAGVPVDLTQAQGAAVIAGTIVSSIGYTAAAPVTLVLLASGHTSGLYQINFDVIVRTAATTGTLARSAAYNAPTLGATTAGAGGTVSATTTGHLGAGVTPFQFNVPMNVRSDGTADITLTLTPAAITGAPVIDIYASATLLSL